MHHHRFGQKVHLSNFELLASWKADCSQLSFKTNLTLIRQYLAEIWNFDFWEFRFPDITSFEKMLHYSKYPWISFAPIRHDSSNIFSRTVSRRYKQSCWFHFYGNKVFLLLSPSYHRKEPQGITTMRDGDHPGRMSRTWSSGVGDTYASFVQNDRIIVVSASTKCFLGSCFWKSWPY